MTERTGCGHRYSTRDPPIKATLTVLLSRKHTEFMQMNIEVGLRFSKRMKRQKDIKVFYGESKESSCHRLSYS